MAAQAATLPVVLASFGRLALIAPVVNLFVVPLVAPAMAAGIVALLGGALVAAGAPSAIGAVLAAPGWVALRMIIGIVDVAAAVPLASVTLEPPIGPIVGLVSLVLTGVVLAWLRRRPLYLTPRPSASDVETRGQHGGSASPSRWPRLAARLWSSQGPSRVRSWSRGQTASRA